MPLMSRDLLGDAGLHNLEPTPSVVNLQALEAEEHMVEHIRRDTQASNWSLNISGRDRGGGRSAAAAAAAAAAATGGLGVLGEEGEATTPPVSPSTAPLPALFAVTAPLVRMGMMNVVDDSFTRCFKSQKRVNWNWNVYLWPAWALGVVLRYAVLFPLRLLALVLGFLAILLIMPLMKLLQLVMDTRKMEIGLIQLLASAFVASWSGVVRIHGIRPTPRPGKPAGVFVANHSSMIDFILLMQSHPYAVVGQHHPGWVGMLQDHILCSLHPVWFNRGETKDRRIVAERLQAHAHDASKADNPLLVFPEGTCVNNEYVVQFKKGVFELGVPINPVAIKYNKVFVDGYWNSREQSFAQHLFRLMTSWAVVADIWFLDQQTIRPGEAPVDFARRVQRLIATRAGLKAVDWDGYMKYWKPNARFLERQQRLVAEQLYGELGMPFAAAATFPGGGSAARGGGDVAAEAVVTDAAAVPAPPPAEVEGGEPAAAAAASDGGSDGRAGASAGAARLTPTSGSSSVVSRLSAGSSVDAHKQPQQPPHGTPVPHHLSSSGSRVATMSARSAVGGGSTARRGTPTAPSSPSGVFTRNRAGTHGTVTSLVSAASNTPRIRHTQPLVGEGFASFPDGDALVYHRDRRESSDPDASGTDGEEDGGGVGGGSGGDRAATSAGAHHAPRAPAPAAAAAPAHHAPLLPPRAATPTQPTPQRAPLAVPSPPAPHRSREDSVRAAVAAGAVTAARLSPAQVPSVVGSEATSSSSGGGGSGGDRSAPGVASSSIALEVVEGAKEEEGEGEGEEGARGAPPPPPIVVPGVWAGGTFDAPGPAAGGDDDSPHVGASLEDDLSAELGAVPAPGHGSPGGGGLARRRRPQRA